MGNIVEKIDGILGKYIPEAVDDADKRKKNMEREKKRNEKEKENKTKENEKKNKEQLYQRFESEFYGLITNQQKLTDEKYELKRSFRKGMDEKKLEEIENKLDDIDKKLERISLKYKDFDSFNTRFREENDNLFDD